VRWNGEPIGALGESFRAALAFCGHANALKEDLTPVENLLASASLYGCPLQRTRCERHSMRSASCRLEALPVRALSQGQKRRVALARLALCKHRLWLLDEPLAALDADAAATLARLVDAHLAQDGLCVLTSHQPVALQARTRSLALS
jgi:heme exporter protein A